MDLSQYMNQRALPAATIGSQTIADFLYALCIQIDAAVTQHLVLSGTSSHIAQLSSIPFQHPIHSLIQAMGSVIPRVGMSPSQSAQVLTFAKWIFHRLHDSSLPTEPLRLEVDAAILERIRSVFPQVGVDIFIWCTACPMTTEVQRSRHRTVLLLLIQRRILSPAQVDHHVASRAPQGSLMEWIEFSLSLLESPFMTQVNVRTSYPQICQCIIHSSQSIADPMSPSLEKRLKGFLGRLQGNQQQHTVSVLPRIPTTPDSKISKAAKVTPGSPPSNTSSSSSTLAKTASNISKTTALSMKEDPPEAKKNVEFVLREWFLLQPKLHDKVSVEHFVMILKQAGVGSVQDTTERFMRLASLYATDAQFRAELRNPNEASTSRVSKLLAFLFRHLNTTVEACLAFLNQMISTIMRTLIWHCNVQKSRNTQWQQSPWTALIRQLVLEIGKHDPFFETAREEIARISRIIVQVCQPAQPESAIPTRQLVKTQYAPRNEPRHHFHADFHHGYFPGDPDWDPDDGTRDQLFLRPIQRNEFSNWLTQRKQEWRKRYKVYQIPDEPIAGESEYEFWKEERTVVTDFWTDQGHSSFGEWLSVRKSEWRKRYKVHQFSFDLEDDEDSNVATDFWTNQGFASFDEWLKASKSKWSSTYSWRKKKRKRIENDCDKVVSLCNESFENWLRIRKNQWRVERRRRQLLRAESSEPEQGIHAPREDAKCTASQPSPTSVTQTPNNDDIQVIDKLIEDQERQREAANQRCTFDLSLLLDASNGAPDDVVTHFMGFLLDQERARLLCLDTNTRRHLTERAEVWKSLCPPRWNLPRRPRKQWHESKS